MTVEQTKRLFLVDVVLVGLLVLSLLLNVFQGLRIKTLEELLVTIKDEHRIAVGDQLSDLRALTSEGNVLDIQFNEEAPCRLFYVASVTCNWCLANRDSVHFLATRVAPDVELFAFVDDPSRVHLVLEMSTARWSVLNHEVLHSLKGGVSGTPFAFTLTPDGIVSGVQRGAMSLEAYQNLVSDPSWCSR
jgi:hypothetical protein